MQKHGGIPPFAETRAYVRKIFCLLEGGCEGDELEPSGRPVRIVRDANNRIVLTTAGAGRVKNLPNFLTLIRILLVPILVTVLFTKVDGKEWWGLALFLLAALTDFLDGYFARRWGRITRLGQLLDPAADKILIASAFISLVELESGDHAGLDGGHDPGARVRGRRRCAASPRRRGWIVPAGWSGKIKTAVQIVSVSLLIVYNQLGEFRHLAPISLWVAVVVTFLSGVEYFVRYRRLLAADLPPTGTAPP